MKPTYKPQVAKKHQTYFLAETNIEEMEDAPVKLDTGAGSI